MFAELENHLYLLRKQLSDLNEDPAFLKVISGELRALLCFSMTEGLLWRLVDSTGVSDKVRLHLAGRVNPDHPLAKGLRLAVVPVGRPRAYLEKDLPSALYSFKDVIKSAAAVYTLGKSYTHEQVIKMVAEQSGVCHEDDGVCPALACMEEILLGEEPSYSLVLRTLAEITLQIGERVLAQAEEHAAFCRRKLSPPVSLSIHCALRRVPLGRVPVIKFRSSIAEVSVEVFMMPESFLFSIVKSHVSTFEVATPFPADWKEGEDAAFCLTYVHESQCLQAFSPGIRGDKVDGCNLGYVDATDIVFAPDPACSKNLLLKAAYTHKRAFTEEEVAQLPELLIEPPVISPE